MIMKLILSLSHLRYNSGGAKPFSGGGGKMLPLPPPRKIPALVLYTHVRLTNGITVLCGMASWLVWATMASPIQLSLQSCLEISSAYNPFFSNGLHNIPPLLP